MLRTTPLIRNSGGLCGSVSTRWRSAVLALLAAPHLRPGQEEALVAGQAVDHRRLAMLGDVAAIGGIGHFEPAEIADILAHGELRIDLEAGQRLVGAILRAEPRGALGEALGRRLAVHQSRTRPCGVEAAALVVEAVADLVADHRADRAVIDRRIGVGIEEGRLQDAGREGDLVEQRVVGGVDRLRRSFPTSARSTGLGSRDSCRFQLELGRRDSMLPSRSSRIDADRRNSRSTRSGWPMRGSNASSLASASAPGLLVHPVELLQPLGEGGAQIADQLVHLPPALGREVALDIDLADRLAERAVEQAEAALPAVALLLLAARGCGRRS